MEIRVVIKPKSEDVPVDFLCVFLNKTIDMPLEECREIFREKGSITFFVKDEETLERIQVFGKKYEHLISIEVERVLSESSIFKFIKDFTLNNLPFFVVWCSILSIVAWITYELRKEVLGFFLKQVFLLSLALGFSEITEKEERGESYKLDLFFPITNYLFTALGLFIGEILLTSIALLLLPFSVVFLLWYFYVFPIVIANAYGKNSLFKGFEAAFSIFNGKIFRFSFTEKYSKLGLLWIFVFTVIIISLLVAVPYTGIENPTALLGNFWFNFFLDVLACFVHFFLGVLAYFVKRERDFIRI